MDRAADRRRLGGADGRLGYSEWVAHGGDWGGAVTTALGVARPAGLLGIHLSTPYAFPAEIPSVLSPAERRAVDGLARYAGELGGSNHLQGTRPQTVGFALADSPVGQAAWIYEKYQSKTDNRGRAEDAIDVDRILDTISISWFTNSGASSGASTGTTAQRRWPARTSTSRSRSRCSRTTSRCCRGAGSRTPTATWSTSAKPEHGGHFAALEQPAFLAAEIRTGLRGLGR